MILIADAGGTKTDWRILKDFSIEQACTDGYNPHTHDTSKYIETLSTEFRQIRDQVSKIYFYGAAIYSNNLSFINAMKSLFMNAEIFPNSDVLGSCRALSENDAAFIGILGTGSAGCFYDGKTVKIHPPSLGYVLGDEAAGSKLGILLLRNILRDRLSTEIQDLFNATYGITKDEVYAEVYQGEHPNAYLASFTTFLHEHREQPEIHNLLSAEFRNYYQAYFEPMEHKEKYSFHFAGSVAFYFQDFLRKIGEELGYSVGRIVQNPISGLALYHQKHG